MRDRFRLTMMAGAVGLLLACLGCATTPEPGDATGQKRTAEAPYPFSRLLVVAVSEDEGMRREFEMAVVDAMHKGESKGISSYEYGQEAGSPATTKDGVGDK